jgi:hypothetical protein
MNNRGKVFLSHVTYRYKEKAAIADCSLLPYKSQPYCWRVALQQSLLPLEADK